MVEYVHPDKALAIMRSLGIDRATLLGLENFSPLSVRPERGDRIK
jgi:hypothetical protein